MYCVWHFCTYLYSLSLNGCHALVCIANNRHGVTITTHAIKRHFLIWMTTVGQPTKSLCFCVLTLKYTFICVYWWTKQRIHNTLIVVDRCLRLMGAKTIPDSAEARLESFYSAFVAGIDLPHQGVVESYNPIQLFICFNGIEGEYPIDNFIVSISTFHWIHMWRRGRHYISSTPQHFTIMTAELRYWWIFGCIMLRLRKHRTRAIPW